MTHCLSSVQAFTDCLDACHYAQSINLDSIAFVDLWEHFEQGLCRDSDEDDIHQMGTYYSLVTMNDVAMAATMKSATITAVASDQASPQAFRNCFVATFGFDQSYIEACCTTRVDSPNMWAQLIIYSQVKPFILDNTDIVVLVRLF